MSKTIRKEKTEAKKKKPMFNKASRSADRQALNQLKRR